MPTEKADERPMIFHGRPERPVTLVHAAAQDGSGGVHVLGESSIAPQRMIQTHLKFHEVKTVHGPGRKQAKQRHPSCGQAAAMHCNMLKQAGGGKKAASPAVTSEGTPVRSSGKEEGWSAEEWEVVRRRLEEAGEVAMTLVYKDGSSQLRPAQVNNEASHVQDY